MMRDTVYQPPHWWSSGEPSPIDSGGEGHNDKINCYMNIDIISIAREAPGTIIAVRADDLVEANNRLINKVKADLERELAKKQEVTYLTRSMVLEKLNVDPSTLWRWKQRGYLVPVNVGGQNRYRSTDIDKILEGER